MKLLQNMLAAIIFCGLACGMQTAQSTQRSDAVIGMAGTVNLIPSPSTAHTTVVFTSNTLLSSTSNQIVFVLQEQNSATPPAWSGPARVLTGDGFLGIVSTDDPTQKWILKFTDRDVPPLLANQGFQVFDVFGIARYGETTPLTSQQISSLAATGRNCGTPLKNKVKEFSATDSPANSESMQPLHANPICNGQCTAGGAGSSSCSAGGGGCSVTCQSGYSSCCDANSNQCGCCQ